MFKIIISTLYLVGVVLGQDLPYRVQMDVGPNFMPQVPYQVINGLTNETLPGTNLLIANGLVGTNWIWADNCTSTLTTPSGGNCSE